MPPGARRLTTTRTRRSITGASCSGTHSVPSPTRRISPLTTTQTRTATQTSTLTKVVYVTRKVQADLFALVDTYSQITPEYARKLIHDLRLLLDEEVINRIELVWTKGLSQNKCTIEWERRR
ncbi:MAG: hypothetical protein ACREM3_27085 [Candidatus Rokuibacteriota bacterium]